MTKIVYSIDENGFYVGDYKCQESPLEPGLFLIPARAVEVAPPVVFSDLEAKWDGMQWVVVGAKRITLAKERAAKDAQDAADKIAEDERIRQLLQAEIAREAARNAAAEKALNANLNAITTIANTKVFLADLVDYLKVRLG